MLNNNLAIIGAGGHAQVCIDIFRSAKIEPACCIALEDANNQCLGVPVLKSKDVVSNVVEKYESLFIAIGNNKIRNNIFNIINKKNKKLISAISPYSIISESVYIDKGVAIMPGVIINSCTQVGLLSIINTNTSIDHGCNINACVHIAPGCTLAGNVTIGFGSFLGVGVKVIPNINIGSNCLIGAGSVVVNDIPSGSKVAGVPAKIL